MHHESCNLEPLKERKEDRGKNKHQTGESPPLSGDIPVTTPPRLAERWSGVVLRDVGEGCSLSKVQFHESKLENLKFQLRLQQSNQ